MSLSEKDVEGKINTIIQGDYSGERITLVNGVVMVGTRVIDSQNCEKCEILSTGGDTGNVKRTKLGFAAKAVATVLFPPAAIVTAKSGYRDLRSFGKLVKINWRNGSESLAFVEEFIAGKIGNMFF